MENGIDFEPTDVEVIEVIPVDYISDYMERLKLDMKYCRYGTKQYEIAEAKVEAFDTMIKSWRKSLEYGF